MANVWPLVGVYGVLWAASGVFVDILTIFWAYLTHEVLTLGSSGLWTCMASDLQFHAVLPLDEVADRCDHQHDVWMWVPSGNWKWATKICPFKNRSFPSLCWILLNCQRVFDGICVFCGFLEVDGISPVPWETRGIFYPLWGGGQHGCWGLLCRWLPISLAAARVLWIAWLHFAVIQHDTWYIMGMNKFWIILIYVYIYSIHSMYMYIYNM